MLAIRAQVFKIGCKILEFSFKINFHLKNEKKVGFTNNVHTDIMQNMYKYE